MKKTICLSFSLLLFSSFEAQKSTPLDAGKYIPLNGSYYETYEASWMKALAPGKKIRSIETTSSKNEKNNYIMALNKDGEMLEWKGYRYGRMGPFWKRRYFHEKLEYNNGLASRVDFYDRKGQITGQNFYEYFSPHKLKRSVFTHKGKKKLEKTAEFNADSNITGFVSYRFKKEKPVQKVKYEYEYYPDKQNKETRMYNSHNKLKYVWRYDCNPKGEIKKEKESQICKNTGTDNRGRLVETIFNTDSKGHKTKTVHTYYMFGEKKVEVQLENYIIKKGVERKWHEMHFPDSVEKYYLYTYYDRKGRISSQGRTEYLVYNSARKIISQNTHTYYSRNKMIFKHEEKFNEKGTPLGSTVTDKRGKIIGRTEFIYQDDTQYIISHYNKKQKLSETYTTKIGYY
jgi:hypothetical protein